MPNVFAPAAPNVFSADPQRQDLTYDELFAPGQVARGLRSSAFSTDAGGAASDYWQARAAGDPATARAQGLRAQQLAEEAARSAPRVQSVGDIHSGSDGADWFMGALGAAPVSMVPALTGGLSGALAGARFGPAGATLGGMAGAATGMQGDLRNAARLQQAQAEAQGAPALAPQQVLDDTNQQGWVQAGVESLVPGMVGKSFVTRSLKPQGFLRTLGTDVALDSGAAAVSEGAALGYETGRNPERDTSGDMMRYADAAAGEAVAGAGYGTLHHAGNVVQGALGGGVDVGGRLAQAGGRALKAGAGSAGELGGEAWANRPKTLDEAAVMAGEGAAKLHNKAEDLVTRVMQHGKDADVDALLTPQTGMDEMSMRKDDEAKHAAAANLVAKLAESPDSVPDYVLKAAETYAQSSRAMDTWAPLKDAVNDWKRSASLGDAFHEFSQEAADKLGTTAAKLMNAKDDAVTTYKGKRAVDGRNNAQTPEMQDLVMSLRDDLSPLIDEKLAPLTGLKSQDALDQAVPMLTHGLRTWIEKGFSLDDKPVVPKALLRMFTDPAKAVSETFDLLHRQGLVNDSKLKIRDWVLAKISTMQEAQKAKWGIVHDNLLPTEAAKLNALDHDSIAQRLQNELDAGNTFAAMGLAGKHFGPRAGAVLDAFRQKDADAKREQALRDLNREKASGGSRTGAAVEDAAISEGDTTAGEVGEGMDQDTLSQMTDGQSPNELGATTQWHHYRPANSKNPADPFKVGGHSVDPETGEVVARHDAKAPERIAELQTKNGSEVTRQGYLDYLREKHDGDADALMAEATDMMGRKDKEIRAILDKYTAEGKTPPRPDEVLNDNWYVLKEKAHVSGEGTNVRADEFKHVSPGSAWGEHAADKYGTTKHGRIWLERVDSRDETGAPVKVTQFATSTSRIISRMSRGRKGEGRTDESGQTAGQLTLLHQGLTSLLTAADSNGVNALTGRVGFKESASGPVRWLKEGEDLPDSLRMHSKTATYKDAKGAVKRLRDTKLIEDAKDRVRQLTEKDRDLRPEEVAMIKAVEQALARKDINDLTNVLRAFDQKNDALRIARDETAPIGADTVETVASTKSTLIGSGPNNRFGSKKLALDSAKEGDRVVRRGKGWFIERDFKYQDRVQSGLPTEISEMGKTSNIRSLQEDSTSRGPRNADEKSGLPLHPEVRETATAKSDRDAIAAKASAAEAAKETRAQRTEYLLNALRNGVPAFNEMARKLPAERRAALLEHFKAMIESDAKNPLWGGKPPKDMTAFGNRARAALVALGELKGATKKVLAAPKQTFDDVADKMHNYLDNPPDDFNVKQVEAIRDWATKQEARLNEAKRQHEEGSDKWEELDDKRVHATMLKLKAENVLKNEAQVAEHAAETGGPRYNAQTTYSGKLADKPIFTELTAGKPEDQALVKKLNARLGRAADGRRAAVLPKSQNADTARAERVAGAMGKRVVWVRNLGTEGVSDPTIPGVIFLDPASRRSVQVLTAHELAHGLERDNPAAFSDLVDGIRQHLDTNQWEQFVTRTQKATVADGGKPLSAAGLRSEMVANLLADYAYRNHADAAGAEFAARGGDFTGYGGYLKTGAQDAVDAALGKFLKAHGAGPETFANKQAPQGAAFSSAKAASPEEQAKFHADILRRLGPQMKSGLLEMLYGKDAKGKDIMLSGKWEKGAIYASVYARNLGQIGAHEAFHEFFSRLRDEPAAADVLKVLDRAANSPYVKRQLERLLDGEKEALAQIKDGAKHSAEERMAYMFQFHQAGLLTIGPETEGVFAKVSRFFRKVAGLINDDERADLLLRAFDRGDAQTADAAARVLANSVTARVQLYKSVNTALVPVINKVSRAVNTTETNLERIGVKEYHDVRRLFKRSVGESGPQGFLDAKDHMMKQWSNKLANVFEGKEIKDLELAAKYLHSGERPTDPVVKDIMIKLQSKDGLLPMMRKYLMDAGVKRWETDPDVPGKGEWVPMGKIDHKYFPRVYDTAMIVSDPDGFVSDFSKYNAAELNKIAAEHNALMAKSGITDATPVTAEDMARAIMNRLINGYGSELEETSTDMQIGEGGKAALKESKGSIGFSPLMQAVNKRQLHWISPEMLKKYGEKDIAKVLTAYVAQGVKRAEYVRRFGNGGEVLRNMMKDAYEANVKRLMDGGMNSDKAVIEALKTAQGAATDVMALEGTLGYDISPKLRRFENSLLVYQNMRLLSTSLFSQFIDPLGIVVRGGTMTDAWNSYKRGIREVVASIKGDPIKDLDSQIADQVGTTDAGGMLAAFGQLHSSQYMGSTFRKANEVLFKYNGMEGFNRGMQVSATRAAINFIKRHVQQPNERSADYLRELNLTPKLVVIDAKGELDYTNPRIQKAIHQWVNGSVMRPNAAQRPAWGSDPHYMVFWHMKQFAYTFHDVIMKRASHDYKKYGDMGPAGVLLAAYAPVMIATDALKGVLLTGGDEPAWMRAGLGSQIEHGAMRAGLMGKFQPGADVMGPHRTILGLGGPAVEQLTQIFDKSPVDSAINALPGANVWNTMKGGAMVEVQGED